MNLLDIVQKRVPLRKVGADEWHGPCPSCGSSQANPALSDRFTVKVSSGGEDHWFCRNCGHGDTIAFLMQFERMSFPEACKEVGKQLPEQEEYQAPRFKKPAADTFQPRTITAPADLWIEHATKLVDWAHDQLLANQEQLDYLLGRGITLESIIKHRLGYNPGENGKALFKARSAWGLPVDKKSKLWLPIGIVIPCFSSLPPAGGGQVGGVLRRVRIRIPNDLRTEEFNLPYYLVPGSSMDTFITNPAARAFVIIEAELDAILVDRFAGDLVGTMAMGNSTAKPTDDAAKLLAECLHISNALDYDAKVENDKYVNAGGTGSLWWKKTFPQSERWPVPVGKDPGDAFKAGINLREWVKAGLPPVLTLPPAPPAPAKPASAPRPQDHNSGADISAAPSEPETAPVVVTKIAQDGRTFHITENKTEYARLVAAGEIVFDFAEIELAIKSGADPKQAAHFLTAKQTFPGIRLADVVLDEIKKDQTEEIC